MRFVVLFIILAAMLNANDIEKELVSIESSIAKAKIDFAEQKNDRNITKLLAISKELYENNQKLKKLKSDFGVFDPIKLKCNDEPCTNPQLQVGDKLSVIFTLAFGASTDYEKNILAWQIQYNGKIIKNESNDIYEKEGLKSFSYDVIIDESYAQGKYRIAMHHQSPTTTNKAESFFSVIKPLIVDNIVVSTNKNAKSSDDAFYPDKDIYILSGFRLSNEKQKISIDVKLADVDKNEILIETSFIRPKADDNATTHPLRFLIPSSKLYEGQKLSFSMNLHSETINQIVKQTRISVKSYQIRFVGPHQLQSGKNAKYTLHVPSQFVQPIQVDIEPEGAILVASNSQLRGTIEAVGKDNSTALLKIKVTDAKGKIARSLEQIQITAKQLLDPQKDLTNSKNKIVLENPSGSGGWIKIVFDVGGKGNSYKNVNPYFKNYSIIGMKKIQQVLKTYQVKNVVVFSKSGSWKQYWYFDTYGYLTKMEQVLLNSAMEWANGMVEDEYFINNDGSFTEKKYRFSSKRYLDMEYHHDSNGKIIKRISYKQDGSVAGVVYE